MVSDSVPSPSIALALCNSNDISKKKRVNRSAKLKQCKLDARREQWLSQVKEKGGIKEGLMGGGGEICRANDRVKNEHGNVPSLHHSSDSNSPTSSLSLLGRNDSEVNFTASNSSGSCFSHSESEEKEEDNCLDDWEDMADALAAEEGSQEEHNPSSGYNSKLTNERFFGNGISIGKNSHAWSPDDAFRPRSLPNLSRLYNLQLNSAACTSSCPICFDVLDGTDLNFLPCLCGFRLCLFCHKRIIENDGRCPGCRKEYDCEHVMIFGIVSGP